MAQQRLPRKHNDHGRDVEAALGALDAEELRALVGETLDGLDRSQRGPIEDRLLRRAAARGGYRPTPPAPQIVGEVLELVMAARRVGYADPLEIDEYLRSGVTASLAGEHATARRILGALLLPIAEAEIDLGQHEMVEEVLSVDLQDCVGRYLLAVYLETPAPGRVDAILNATEQIRGIGALTEPVRAMEGSFGHPLPEGDAFLEAWIERLEASSRSGSDYESEHDRWLRDAVARHEGAAGLARIARATNGPEVVSAWCDEVVKEGDWKRAFAVYREAVEIVTSDVWRGQFLDGAALAASKLGRRDATKKLEAAWLGAPSLARLLRWLVADEAPGASIRARAAAALDANPTKSKRLLAFLQALVGDIPAAAKALKSAPGLGWSSEDHPGHLLFPVCAWLLTNGEPKAVVAEVVEVLNHPPRSLFESGLDPADPSTTLPTPTVLHVLDRAGVRARLTVRDRTAALDAIMSAASKRSEGVTGKGRRRHYEHAATLVGCCVEVDREGSAGWLEALRTSTSRFPAFQGALRAALGGRVRSPAMRSFADGA